MSPLAALLQAIREQCHDAITIDTVQIAIAIEAASEEAKPGSSETVLGTTNKKHAPLPDGYAAYSQPAAGLNVTSEPAPAPHPGCQCPMCQAARKVAGLTDERLGEIRRRHKIIELCKESGHRFDWTAEDAHADRGVLLAEIERLKKELDYP